MACEQMGGPCGAKVQGSTPDEMMKNGMEHLEKAHPKMAEDMKKMAKDDTEMVKWNNKFMEEWEKNLDDDEE